MSLDPEPQPADEAVTLGEEHLAPWAQSLMLRAYGERARMRCSRADFVAGFIAAFIGMRWRTAFRDDFEWKGWPVQPYEMLPIVEMMIAGGPRSVVGVPPPELEGR